MAKKKRKQKTKKITNRFWDTNLNPITGWHVSRHNKYAPRPKPSHLRDFY